MFVSFKKMALYAPSAPHLSIKNPIKRMTFKCGTIIPQMSLLTGFIYITINKKKSDKYEELGKMRIGRPSALSAFLLAGSMIGANVAQADISAHPPKLDMNGRIRICTQYNNKTNIVIVNQTVPFDTSPETYENIQAIFDNNVKTISESFMGVLAATDEPDKIQAVMQDIVEDINSYNKIYTALSLALMNPQIDRQSLDKITKSVGTINLTPLNIKEGCGPEFDKLAYDQ
jgi:hypothetical protein